MVAARQETLRYIGAGVTAIIKTHSLTGMTSTVINTEQALSTPGRIVTCWWFCLTIFMKPWKKVLTSQEFNDILLARKYMCSFMCLGKNNKGLFLIKFNNNLTMRNFSCILPLIPRTHDDAFSDQTIFDLKGKFPRESFSLKGGDRFKNS